MKIIQNIRQYISKANALLIANKGLSIGIAAFVVFTIIGGLYVYSSCKNETKPVVSEKTLFERLLGEVEKLSAAQKFGIVVSIPVTTAACKALLSRNIKSNVGYYVEYIVPTRLECWLFSASSKIIILLSALFGSTFVVGQNTGIVKNRIILSPETKEAQEEHKIITAQIESSIEHQIKFKQETDKKRESITDKKSDQGIKNLKALEEDSTEMTERLGLEQKNLNEKLVKSKEDLAKAKLKDKSIEAHFSISTEDFIGPRFNKEAINKSLEGEYRVANGVIKPEERTDRQKKLIDEYAKTGKTEEWNLGYFESFNQMMISFRVMPAKIVSQIFVISNEVYRKLTLFLIWYSSFGTTHLIKLAFVPVVLTALYVFNFAFASTAIGFLIKNFFAAASFCSPVGVLIQKIIFPLVIKEVLNTYVDDVLVGSEVLSIRYVLTPLTQVK
jgi:hypothetical protein